MANPAVILYRYNASPFAHKIDHVLTVKNIPHKRVKVKVVLPRPELSDLLGIAYRRIPVLAIGNDVYCDTSLISSALERRFPSSAGYGTIFPPRKASGLSDEWIIESFCRQYAEGVLFPLALNLLNWESFPSSFLADRGSWMGSTIDTQSMVAMRPKNISLVSSHLIYLESQLADGREWLFETEKPSLADISVYMIYAWLRTFPIETPFSPDIHVYTLKWMARMAEHLNSKRTPPIFSDITGAEAAKLILDSPFESYDVVGFDSVEAKRLDVKPNNLVSITPDDTGRAFPTIGKLACLSRKEFVIEIVPKGGSSAIRCHFPRIGYTIEKISVMTTKL